MSILVNENTKVIIQGITGSIGRFIAHRMITEGDTNLVAGVTPGKGGTFVEGVPVFNSVKEAVKLTGANTCLVIVPAKALTDAILESADAGISLCVAYTEGTPAHDTAKVVEYARLKGMRLIGPNAAGIASPGKANVGEFMNSLLKPGKIGILSKSGTLTYDVIKFASLYKGISTLACLGGDMTPGTRVDDVLPMFEKDNDTEVVILLGEIGGIDEIVAANYVPCMTKPVISYICGLYAPKEKPMGHAGAIQNSYLDTALGKKEVLESKGALVARTRGEIFDLVRMTYESNRV